MCYSVSMISMPCSRVWCPSCMQQCLGSHYLCHNRILLSNGNRLQLVHAVEVGICLKNILSSSIGVNSAERLDIKKAVAHRPPHYSLFVH
ncbi:unnamed protein product [Hymenolepis diminuta]|uniref:Uncharacterized protein n=1 Tax=Hymenolepis diminuta TaxID=6216 RepID=A0A564ZDA1_HYMDI|nr:unnamed protein product [Hymenolepis diminuta]